MQPVNKLLSFFVTAIIILGVISLFLPTEVHVERSMVINAPAWLTYEQVNNLKNWEKWSPWKQADPEIRLDYQGPAAGNGAQYSWKSRRRVLGTGKLTIADTEPNKRIVTEMYFVHKGRGIATHTFEETPEGTLVTWAVDSKLGHNPVKKYAGLFWGSLIGPDFERGLSNLKIVAEESEKSRRSQSYNQK
ncbi:SRPBCC family protein [Pontibacter ruber]|uniref:SRPBCC family protein n=1 Tax=Pontibacter ruber TaxID=1343895 RepID=A0ABW5CVB9_9BACT|nr:SRPBCC family protein [Pontibacter ruber]